jgi:hypothetical protein
MRGPAAHRIWIGSNNLTQDGLNKQRRVRRRVTARGYSEGVAVVERGSHRWERGAERRVAEFVRNSSAGPSRPAASRQCRCLCLESPARNRQAEEDRLLPAPVTSSWKSCLKRPDLTETTSDSYESCDCILRARVPTRSSTTIHLRSSRTREWKQLTMTRFANKTARLSLHDLEYRDRPCVIIFHRRGREVRYEIVPQSTFLVTTVRCLPNALSRRGKAAGDGVSR